MADMADIDQVEECWEQLAEVYGDMDTPDADGLVPVIPVTYMNSSAAIKGFVGRHGGIVCTSSNARTVLEWAFERGRRVLFFPDQHLGRNTAKAMGVPLEQMPMWNPRKPLGGSTADELEGARVILWHGFCSVHRRFTVEQIDKARAEHPGVRVIVHPECPMAVVDAADESGSTDYIRRAIEARDRAHDVRDRHRGEPRAAPRRREPAARDLLPRPGRLPLLDDVPHPPRLPRVGARGPRRRARCSTASPCRRTSPTRHASPSSGCWRPSPRQRPSPIGRTPHDRPSATVHAVVVGSGIAGLTVALHAVESGCRVTLVTKDVLEHANTRYAQGGIAGVMFADDRAEDHIRDTLTAGAGLSDPEAVRVLVDEGPARIRELIALGVAFDRGADGDFVKGLEAAHSYPRILHSGGDATGTAIEKALVARLRASEVRVDRARVPDRHRAATAGASRRRAAVGDASCSVPTAVAAAARSSRPTPSCSRRAAPASCTRTRRTPRSRPATASPRPSARAPRCATSSSSSSTRRCWRQADAAGWRGESFLVSEAVRGEGATLIDEHGRRFAFDAHPDGELAPRDVVARAIARQMEAQDGRPVFLDATGLRPTYDERASSSRAGSPRSTAPCASAGLDWARDPIPVTPAAHYLMGGVTTDLTGRTTLPGLYAVGEVARTGVHGANRLASNSLLEGAVFGARAGDAIAADAASGAWPGAAADRARRRRAEPRLATPRAADAGRPFSRARAAGADVGGRRTRPRRRRASSTRHPSSRRGARSRAPRAPRPSSRTRTCSSSPTQLVAAALRRRESVGAHFRADDPGADRRRTPRHPSPPIRSTAGAA